MLAGFFMAGMYVLLTPGLWSGTHAPLILLVFYKYAGVSVVHLDSSADVQFVAGGEKRAAQQGTTRVRFEYGENHFLLLCPESRRWRPVGSFFSTNRNCSFEVNLRCNGKSDRDVECKFGRRVRWGVSWLLACEARGGAETKPCMGGPSEEDESAEEPQAANPNQGSP
jgi:hypothetical protein